MRLTACPLLTFTVTIPVPPIGYNQYLSVYLTQAPGV